MPYYKKKPTAKSAQNTTKHDAPAEFALPEDKQNAYGLTPAGLALAFFLALRSQVSSYSGPSLDDFKQYFGISLQQLNMAESELLSKKMMTSSSSYYYSSGQRIADQYILPLCHLLVSQYPDLTKFFEGKMNSWIGVTRVISMMRWACSSIADIDPKDFYITEAMAALIENLDFSDNQDWKFRLCHFLHYESIIDIALGIVRSCEIGETTTATDQLIKLATYADIESKTQKQLEDALAYIKYVADGVPPLLPGSGKIPSTRPFLLCCAGIMAAYKGLPALSIDYLTKAGKGFKKFVNYGDVPPLLFPAYFLAVEYNITYNVAALQSLAMRTNVNYIKPATVVASAAISDNSKPSMAVFDALKDTDKPTLSAFYRLFNLYYYQIADNSSTYAVPALALLRSEVRPVMNLTDEEKSKLEASFGPKPLLYSITKLSRWEKKMNEIMRDLDTAISNENAAEASEAAAPSQRFLFVCNNKNTEVEVKRQTTLKSGGWSVFKNVSAKTFVEDMGSYTDPYDLAIAGLVAKRLRDTNYYYYGYSAWPYASEALPALVGCDRVYHIENNEPVLTAVKEEKVTVKIVEKGGKLIVSCNVPSESFQKDTPYYITYDSKKKVYSVYKISNSFSKVISKILREGTFPLDTKDTLTVLLAKMSEYVKVDSPLLSSDAIPGHDGDPTVIVQLTPASGGMYNAVIFVRPYPESRHKHIPGKGKEAYIALMGGKSTRITRDFTAETRNLDALSDALTDTNADIDYADSTATLDIDAVLTLLEWAKANPNKVAVEWPEKNGIRLQRTISGSWNVSLKNDNGWFDIEGDVRLDDATVLSMTQLLQSMAHSSGKYIRLDDGKFLEIDKRLRSQLSKLESLAVKNRGKMQISQFNAALLDDSLASGEMKVHFDDKLVALQNRIAVAAKYEPAIPTNLNATLRPYQEDGFRWMARLAAWGAGSCLADDMGLGKTVQTIAFLLLKADEGPALVVAPASVVPNWASELERFAPSLNVRIVNKAEDREATIKSAKGYDVVLITYGLLSNELEALTSLKWATICLDEAHTIKNRDTKMSQAAMALNSEYRIALTGTPLQNNLGELWNLFRFINPGLLGTYESFREKFVRPITEEGDRERRHSLQRIIKPFMLRRTKTDVASDLPEKTEVYIPIELSNEEAAYYEAMRLKASKALETMDKVDVSTLAEISRLRRAACCIELVDQQWKGPNSKVQAFLDLVADNQGADNNMLVFSQYTSFLEIVRKALDEAGIRYLYLDGSTPMSKREKLVEEFNQGKTPLFLISLKAGGLGLNLPAANYVVHLDPWWNPAIEQQATDRAYRIGQKRKVMVYHMLAKGTIEEKIRRLHATKRDMADSLLEGSDMAASLSIKDILELVANR